MRQDKRIGVIIPALDEERAIGKVIAEIPNWVDRIVVADNGSKDNTVAVAKAAGAMVVIEPERGYGAACLRGMRETRDMDVIVFLDGDHSDYPDEMRRLVDPIVKHGFQFVVGSRARGRREKGSLTPQQKYGNRLACTLIWLIWRVRFTDLGPFRAIARTTLDALDMQDRNYGWTVEMQIKAARAGIATLEVPVNYRKRIGVSKVSGTIRGTVAAGTKILTVIARSACLPNRKATRQASGARPAKE